MSQNFRCKEASFGHEDDEAQTNVRKEILRVFYSIDEAMEGRCRIHEAWRWKKEVVLDGHYRKETRRSKYSKTTSMTYSSLHPFALSLRWIFFHVWWLMKSCIVHDLGSSRTIHFLPLPHFDPPVIWIRENTWRNANENKIAKQEKQIFGNWQFHGFWAKITLGLI